MIIQSNLDADLELDVDVETTNTYKVTDTTIQGYIDELEALQQMINHVLDTEQYEYPIYSLDYGFQTDDLIGKDAAYVISEMQRRIVDILTADERISSVDNFVFASNADNLFCTFDVTSIYGTLTAEKGVTV